MGTYLIGPREGLFKKDEKLAFIMQDDSLLEDSDYDSSDEDDPRNYNV